MYICHLKLINLHIQDEDNWDPERLSPDLVHSEDHLNYEVKPRESVLIMYLRIFRETPGGQIIVLQLRH